MRVLVTGGSGNLGRAVVAELAGSGHEPHVFDVRPPSPGVPWIEGTVTDPAATADAVRGMDAVVHLAAIPAYRPEVPAVDFMRVNVTGTFNVLEAAGQAGTPRVAFAGSDSALGFVFATHPFGPEYLPVDEGHPLRPQDPYGLSKQLGEALCARTARRYGTTVACLRFCWVWFEDTWPHRDALAAAPPEPHAASMWGYVDARDAARACRLALENDRLAGCETFFITAPDTFSDTPTAELAARCYPGVPVAGGWLEGPPHRGLFSIDKARLHLGWNPRFMVHGGEGARGS